MTTPADSVTAVAQLMQTLGVDLEDLAAAVQVAGPTQGVTYGQLVDDVLRGLSKHTRRTYRTHLERGRRGIERCCDCLCERCTTTDECGCGPDCRPCQSSMLTVSPLEDVVVNRRTMKTSTLRPLTVCAERIAKKSATRRNRQRVARGLVARPVQGKSACETAIRALSKLMEAAIEDDLLEANPMAKVKAPTRPETTKRGPD